MPLSICISIIFLNLFSLKIIPNDRKWLLLSMNLSPKKSVQIMYLFIQIINDYLLALRRPCSSEVRVTWEFGVETSNCIGDAAEAAKRLAAMSWRRKSELGVRDRRCRPLKRYRGEEIEKRKTSSVFFHPLGSWLTQVLRVGS